MARFSRSQLKMLGRRRTSELFAGVVLLLAGTIMYGNHGFGSSVVFLLALMIIPMGVALVGGSLVGKRD